jgi:anti-sigma regulatory factor (Ser/Thr protein kinase)
VSADKREVGGLGIYMVKNIMDEVGYEYRNGQNILTMMLRKNTV